MIPWTNDTDHHTSRNFTQLDIEAAYLDSDFYFYKHGTVLVKQELTDQGFPQRVLSRWNVAGWTTEKINQEYGYDVVWTLTEGTLPDSLQYSNKDYPVEKIRR